MVLDIIIKNGHIANGTGEKDYIADIGIKGNKIEKIGDLSGIEAETIIDASGKYVTPGFIDPHTHVDNSVLFAPHMENYIKQGVTTVVTGNCGHCMAPIGEEVFRGPIMQMDVCLEADPSYFDLFPMTLPKQKAASAYKKLYGIDVDWSDFGSYLEKCDKLPLGGNLVPLAGYSAIRNAVMGQDCLRDATADEISRLKRVTEECMEQGAFGLSTGRDPLYIPGPYATIEEMTEMLRITAKYEGIFSSHTYNYNKSGKFDRMGGYREMIELGEAAGIRTHVSHVHLAKMANTAEEAVHAAYATIELFDKAAQEGLDISYDIIPNPFASDFTVPYFAFYLKPLVLMSGSRAHLAENLKVPDFRKMVKLILRSDMMPFFNPDSPMNWYDIYHVYAHKKQQFVGKTLTDCAKELKMEKDDVLMYLLSEDPDMSANIIMGGFAEAHNILCQHKMASPCSDGFSFSRETNVTNMKELPLRPNASSISYLPHYLTDQKANDFVGGVRQSTGLVAERFNIEKRGFLKEGFYADVVVIDRANLASNDEKPNDPLDPSGIEWVIVNGKVELAEGKIQNNYGGKVIRRFEQ